MYAGLRSHRLGGAGRVLADLVEFRVASTEKDPAKKPAVMPADPGDDAVRGALALLEAHAGWTPRETLLLRHMAPPEDLFGVDSPPKQGVLDWETFKAARQQMREGMRSLVPLLREGRFEEARELLKGM